MSKLPDLGSVPRDLDKRLRDLLEGMREHIRALRGFDGRGEDIALSENDIRTIVADEVASLPTTGGGGSSSAPVYVPDYTEPPTPSGVSVVAGMAYVTTETNAPTFTAGHGYDRTIVYGAQWPTSQPTAPTFNDAVPVDEFVGNIGSFPTKMATRWCIWVKWRTKDGILSTTAAGGANGFQVTTGQDVALLLQVLSQQITNSQLAADLSAPIALITAPSSTAGSVAARVQAETDARVAAISQEVVNRNAAIGSYAYSKTETDYAVSVVSTSVAAIGVAGDSIWPDPSFADTTMWQLAVPQWGGLPTFTTISDGQAGSRAVRSPTSGSPRGSSMKGTRRTPVVAGRRYRISVLARRTADANGALYLRMDYPGGIITSGQAATLASSAGNGESVAVGTSWALIYWDFVPLAVVGSVSPMLLLNDASTAGYMEAQDLRIRDITDTTQSLIDSKAYTESWAYSKAQADGAIAASSSSVRTDFAAADGATLNSAQTYTVNYAYAKSAVDGAINSLSSTLTAAYQGADTATLNAAKTYSDASVSTYAYSKSQADAAIASSVATVSARLNTGGDVAAAISAAASAASTAQATADGKASASSVTTLQAQVAGTQGSALLSQIQQTATVSAQIDGYLASQYTVRVSTTQGGRQVVGGFGISGTAAPNAGTTIDFGVQADKFWIGAPAGSTGVADVQPFVVQTADTTVNGVVVPKGVYMDAAYIKNVTALWGRFGTLVADSITASQISAAQLTVGDGTVGGDLKSAGYTFGSVGWKLASGGSLFAHSGFIGGVAIAAGALRSGQTALDTGTGFWLGGDGRLSVGNGTTKRLTFDGVDLSVETPGLTINGGSAYFRGVLQGATGQFDGVLAAGVISASAFDSIVVPVSSVGTTSVTIPALKSGWTAMGMRATLVAAGGGGGGGCDGEEYDQYWGWYTFSIGGGGGGQGQRVIWEESAVTPGQTITVIVGAGGQGGLHLSAGRTGAKSDSGSGGGSSSYTYGATTRTASGGGGGGGSGTYVYSSFANPYAYGTTGGSSGGQSGGYANAILEGQPGPGGAGSNSFYGPGGPQNSAAPTSSYGSGGGGGDGYHAGAKGANGYVLLEFFDPNTVVLNNRYRALVNWLDTRGFGTVPEGAR